MPELLLPNPTDDVEPVTPNCEKQYSFAEIINQTSLDYRRKLQGLPIRTRHRALVEIAAWTQSNKDHIPFLWLTESPEMIFPYSTATHVVPGEVLLRILQGDGIGAGGSVYSNQNRLGPRRIVRDALLTVCTYDYHDVGASVWLTAPGNDSNSDLITDLRKDLLPKNWTNAKETCLSFIAYLESIIQRSGIFTENDFKTLGDIIYTTTGMKFSFLIGSVQALMSMPAEQLREFVEKLKKEVVSFRDEFSPLFTDEAPADLGVAVLTVNLAQVMKRVRHASGGFYPVIPSDRNPLLLASAPWIEASEIIRVDCDWQLLDWLFSPDPFATSLRRTPIFKQLQFSQTPDEDLAWNQKGVFDPYNPSCAILYKNPAEVAALWRKFALEGKLAPLVWINPRDGSPRATHFLETFDIQAEQNEADIIRGVFDGGRGDRSTKLKREFSMAFKGQLVL